MRAPDIEADAAEWLIRLESDRSARQRIEFAAWLAADARNRPAYLRLEQTWNRADRLRKLQPIDGQVDENVLDKFGMAHLRD